jgi:hypothetical protein
MQPDRIIATPETKMSKPYKMLFVSKEVRAGTAPVVQCECKCGHRWRAPMWPDPMCPACNPADPAQDPA